jgi:hypothetical protein
MRFLYKYLTDIRSSNFQLFHDRSRLALNSFLDPQRRLRCLFYVLSTISKSAKTRRHGFIMLTCFGKSTRKATLGFDAFARLHQEVLPVRLVAAHAVFLSTRPVFKSFVSLFVRASEKLQFLKGRIVVHDHSSSSPESLLIDLQKHGFDVEGLPKAPLGGLFTFGCFKGWLADRQGLELSRIASNAAAADHLAEGSVEDERRKRKRLDAAYSRRKRYRKRIEVAVMHEEVERLRQQNAKLRREEHLMAKSLFDACICGKNNIQLLGCCN